MTPSLLHNALSIRHWASDRAWSALSHPAPRTIWLEAGVHTYWTGARYSFRDNAFFAPSGLSSAPIFFPGAPSYLHYGAMGLVVGHEMTHGLDANGRKWDAQRRYREWWDQASVEEFENKTKCFVAQFNAFEAVDHNGVAFLNTSFGQPLKLNGAFTLSENIADAGRLSNAWEAWNLAEQQSPSQMLPGLEDWSKEQLFFVAAGQMWCSKYSRASMEAYIARDAHAPPFARIRGIVQNSRACRETWGCEVREPICELW
jgi:endothelin-converting enzyme